MNTMSDNMYSPLADAIYYEYYEITKYLLENGASVEDEHNSVEEALTWVYDEAVIELVESYQ
jgi:ankyrin repeat protein